MTDDTAPMLPGLEPPPASDSPLVRAARANLAELERLELIGPRNELLRELVLSLADAIDKGARTGKASAVALAAAQLRETMLVLDPPDEGASDDARALLDTFMAQLEQHANGADQ